MLLPDLPTIARAGERTIIYLVPMIVGAYGSLQATRLGASHADIRYLDVLSIGGFGVVAMIVLIFTIMLRNAKLEAMQDSRLSARQI
jgi:hypothetical protein